MKIFVLSVACSLLLFCALQFGRFDRPVSAQTPPTIRTLSVQVNDLVYDPYSKLMYGSVPSSVGANGNSVVVIDPVTGNIGPYIFVGSEPNKLALSDDGKYLYVSLDGANGIRRLNLGTRVAEAPFSLGGDSFLGLYKAEDIEVRPGCPDDIAVSLALSGVSPRHGGVALFNNGVRRPNLTQGHTGSNVIEFCSSTAWLYGYNNETTEFGFRRISVNDTGLKQIDVVGNFFGGFGSDFRCSGGRGYSTSGRAFDPQTKSPLGTFSFGSTGSSSIFQVRPDASVNRVFYLLGGSSVAQVRAFDMTTFLPLGSIDIPNVTSSAGSLIRWGTDGLAFRTFPSFSSSGPSQVVLVQSPVISGISAGAVTVSAATFVAGRAAPESIATIFGTGLSAVTATATTVPLPFSLAGVSVLVKDSFGMERNASLFFVSPNQINYLVPAGTAMGNATITINNAGTLVTGGVNIGTVVPGLFSASANGQGVAAAVALRVKADGSQNFESIAQFDTTLNRFVTRPIDLGPETDRVFLILFGTGLRLRSDPAKIIARIGCADTTVAFAGAQGDLVGVDQVNLPIPRTLIGRGEMDVALTLDGQSTNFVKVNIK